MTLPKNFMKGPSPCAKACERDRPVVTEDDRVRAAWWLHNENRLPKMPDGRWLNEVPELVESLAEEFAWLHEVEMSCRSKK